ncbi:hypothetical protein Q3H58_003512 [Pseudomonas psychrotolerans]|nr:hypothetical protein [Pseudomonas psychrotolerans]
MFHSRQPASSARARAIQIPAAVTAATPSVSPAPRRSAARLATAVITPMQITETKEYTDAPSPPPASAAGPRRPIIRVSVNTMAT